MAMARLWICVAVNKMESNAGSYTVVCCAQDSSGNRSSYHTVTVTVEK